MRCAASAWDCASCSNEEEHGRSGAAGRSRVFVGCVGRGNRLLSRMCFDFRTSRFFCQVPPSPREEEVIFGILTRNINVQIPPVHNPEHVFGPQICFFRAVSGVREGLRREWTRQMWRLEGEGSPTLRTLLGRRGDLCASGVHRVHGSPRIRVVSGFLGSVPFPPEGAQGYTRGARRVHNSRAVCRIRWTRKGRIPPPSPSACVGVERRIFASRVHRLHWSPRIRVVPGFLSCAPSPERLHSEARRLHSSPGRCVDGCRPLAIWGRCAFGSVPGHISRSLSVAPRRWGFDLPTYLWPGDIPNAPSRCLPWSRRYMFPRRFRSPGAVCPSGSIPPHPRFVSHPIRHANVRLYFSTRTLVCISE